jgi:hypothetical protein
MKILLMIPKKMIGGIRKKGAPDQINSDNSINSIPKYIGFRVYRNGPDHISVIASVVGQIGFFWCLNSSHPHIMSINPKVKKTTPHH